MLSNLSDSQKLCDTSTDTILCTAYRKGENISAGSINFPCCGSFCNCCEESVALEGNRFVFMASSTFTWSYPVSFIYVVVRRIKCTEHTWIWKKGWSGKYRETNFVKYHKKNFFVSVSTSKWFKKHVHTWTAFVTPFRAYASCFQSS
jgi:hypothetical protein